MRNGKNTTGKHNNIVVQSFEDGTFRVLSNSIEKKELDIQIVK